MTLSSSYLLVHNITKNSNFGFLIRTANAFATELILIGKRKYHMRGAVAGTRRTPAHHFYTLREGVAFARDQGCRILGIEIAPESQSIWDYPFEGPTVFIPGNEGEGLLECHFEVCDDFVYIPQFGNAASLNVNVATAICLHHFVNWSGRAESPRSDNQFAGPETMPSMHRRYQSS
ncbi:MAG: TrmH family RNA methyltransferase [Pirellulaceae bacterium]